MSAGTNATDDWPFGAFRVWDLGSHAQRLARSLHSGPVAATLREAIVTGVLPTGTPLVERTLADQLSVSRGPIRNAVFALESEGLVSTSSTGRATVRGFGGEDIKDLMAVRLELESTGLRWAIENDRDTKPIVDVFNEMKAEGASNQNLVNLDLSFHLAIVESSGSRFLVQAWQAIAPVLHTVITIGNRALQNRDPHSNFERIITSHARIIHPILARDADLAVERLREQFDFTSSSFEPQASPVQG